MPTLPSSLALNNIADGSNIVIAEAVTGTVTGGLGKTALDPNGGSSLTATSWTCTPTLEPSRCA